MTARLATESAPEALRKLIWDLGPPLHTLLEGGGVPRADAADFLRESLDRMALECRRQPISKPRRRLLAAPETRCRENRERPEAREGDTR